MEIKGQVLSWREKIQLQGFQRCNAPLHLKKVLGLAKSHMKKEGGGKAEPEAAPGLVDWIPFTISAMSRSRKCSQRIS